jgi:hypothetical protein
MTGKGKVADIEELKKEDRKDHKGKNLLLYDTTPFKFAIIDKRQIVFLDPILDGEEKADKHPDEGVSSREYQTKCEDNDCLRLIVSEVIGEIIYELLFLNFLFLRLSVTEVLACFDSLMRDIK